MTLAILVIGGTLIAVIYVVVPALRPAKPRIDPEADERARQARAARVCEETRARVVRGAVIGATDVEGWVTELMLLRPAGGERFVTERDLAGVVDPSAGRLVWKETPLLAAISGGHVAVSDASLVGGGRPTRPGLRLSFEGSPYVTAYFREEERSEWIRTASALAKQLGATQGALYARCAAGDAHHLGSWFLGTGADGAAAALLYFMGTYADVPHLAPALLGPDGGAVLDRAFAFERIGGATQGLDRGRLAVALSPHGGMIKGSTQGPFELTFPFRDADRAARASRDLARALKIASN
jgi:hypothetical protein